MTALDPTTASEPPVYERRHYKRRCPEQHQLRERRSRSVMLRMAGVSNLDIGLRLHADPAINSTGEGFVGGYGWRNWMTGNKPLIGVSLANAVSRDIRGELDRGEERLDDLREEFREIELRRLDAAQKAIWQRVNDGNDWAIDRFLGIVDRRMKLLGLEAPAKADVKIDQNLVVQQGAVPEVDAAYATAVLDGIAELASAQQPALEAPDILEPDIAEAEIVEDDA